MRVQSAELINTTSPGLRARLLRFPGREEEMEEKDGRKDTNEAEQKKRHRRGGRPHYLRGRERGLDLMGELKGVAAGSFSFSHKVKHQLMKGLCSLTNQWWRWKWRMANNTQAIFDTDLRLKWVLNGYLSLQRFNYKIWLCAFLSQQKPIAMLVLVNRWQSKRHRT